MKAPDGVDLENKTASYFTSKMGLFGNDRNCNFRHAKLKTTLANLGEEGYFTEKKEESGRGRFEGKSTGGKVSVGW